MSILNEISVTAYAALSNRGSDHLLLDVRNPNEWEIGHIDGASLLPLPELPQRWQELEAWRDKPIYTLCHHGVRSQRAGLFLIQQGFTQVTNITGGIDVWSLEVDPRIARY